MALDDEIFAGCKRVAIWLIHSRFEIIEVDGGHGFFNVKVPWSAIETDAIPIENPVSGV